MATYALRMLTTRNRRVVAMAHGLAGMPALPAPLIGLLEGVDAPCARRILYQSLGDFAERFSAGTIESLRERDSKARLRWRKLPPPKLFRMKRQLHAWQHSEDPEDRLYYSTREWAPLTEPVAWDELLPRIVRAMARFGVASDWLLAPPTTEQAMIDGTEYNELTWRTDEHELCVFAIDGIRNDPRMVEVGVPMLFARLRVALVVNAQEQSAELCLLGTCGAFQAACIEGEAGRLLAKAWEWSK